MPQVEELLNKLVEKLSRWLEDFVLLAPSLMLALLLVVAAVYAGRAVQRGVHQLTLRITGNEPVSQLLSMIARIAVVAIAIFFALGLLKLDKTVTSLLAGVGVVGLALGFAFQDIAANFMSGLIMAFRGPFRVGDLVEVAGHHGRIKTIALRASELETLDGLSILIPNKEIFQNAITNYTSTPNRRMDLAVGTAYGDDMEQVRSVVVQAVQDVPNRKRERDVELFFDAFGDSSINSARVT
jgi:small conductance mechanosensitive channel